VKQVAFLRAVNVAGHARVTIDRLSAAFVSAGCLNVTTHLQSGNVIFEPPPAGTAAALSGVRTRLQRVLGEEPMLAVRSAGQMRRLVSVGFPGGVHPSPAVKRYVAFLFRPARAAAACPIVSPRDALEIRAIRGPHAFVVSRRKPNGFFGLPNNFVEAALGIPATTRNWSTVTKIAARLAGSPPPAVRRSHRDARG
jgi:uncharacterized protein (DUF1697 family)